MQRKQYLIIGNLQRMRSELSCIGKIATGKVKSDKRTVSSYEWNWVVLWPALDWSTEKVKGLVFTE